VSEWNQKAVRASAGSVFRVPVVAITAEELIALKSRGVRLLAAVAPNSETDSNSPIDSKANSEATRKARVVLPATETDLACACALMIGNEGAGLGDEFLALADARITIPTPGRVESLNAAVAGSLLLYEAARQREAAHQRAASQPTTNN
jgi:TrmH family RNA methyltransferase